ncbi:MAG: tellurite methyltransferase [Bryobacterales bacterium]|nr:tellurite methyltransferase [Bryobacterales bacterium]
MTGRALDLACGSGRHALWLARQGWQVTAVDIEIQAIPGVTCIQADLEAHEYRIEPDSWDLIVCWLYWQPDLMPQIARGVRKGGIVGLAGKSSGRFATSLTNYQAAFPGWEELSAGEDGFKVFFIARRE